MIENPIFIGAAYVAASAGISFGMAKLSPTIKRRTRHMFAGLMPMIGVFFGIIASNDVVILNAGEILLPAVLAALGVGTSIMVSGVIPKPKQAKITP